MKIVNLLQGSPEWHAHRAQHFNASDAPAMMSCSPYKTRGELIAELATGITPEVGPAQQRIFDAGHQFEALARPLAEEIAGEELYPVVGAEGKYSASFDGLTMLEDAAFEHKSLNKGLLAAFDDIDTVAPEYRNEQAGLLLPLHYQVQMEQQAMVSGCTRILFMASKWEADRDTGEWVLIQERHCWYTPNLELRAQIVAGWELLEKDVAAYAPPKSDPIAAKIQQALPALRIEASGSITASNLDEFQVVVLDRINAVNMELVTDQDFADGDADGKWLRDVSAKMKEAVQRVRGGMESVDEVLRVLEQLDDIATKKAIAIEKKVKTEKDVRKEQIVLSAQRSLDEHIAELNRSLDARYLASPGPVFASVVKGLKSLDSMTDKVQAELGNQQASANAAAARYKANREHLKQTDGDWVNLFPDFSLAGNKAAEDFQALAALRIGNQKQADAQRLEAEREKIRAQEQAKAEATVRAEQEQKRLAEEAAATAEREKALQAEKDAQATIAEAYKADALPAPLLSDLSAVATFVRDEAVATIDAKQVISAARTGAALVDASETMTLGQINTLIAPIKVDAAGLADLGFEAKTIKAAKHYPASDVPKILAAMVKHLQGLLITA
ncbi:YqaJ viral recombinase family protein [Acidovorax sp. Be4]|uniref:YqaJ viral recombinase family protein n=1 Tax=Acidovorax bellezanensis TaxID=2976702 RepID=A0ABT2PT99_9BURK|nr:YqaJ viral recombinase family protein [Acidovorax sp. Be4]MCT9812452.1 YqaJ viral recombinase family protein [Acidovorax sp. Be4]